MSQLSLSGRIVEQLELNENYSSQRKRFLDAGADSRDINVAFEEFIILKDKGLLSLEQKDIDRYKSFEELRQVIDSLSGVKTKTQQKKEQKVEGAQLVHESDRYRVYYITTWQASKLYGKGTQWCISGDTPDGERVFEKYAGRGSIYFAMPKKGRGQKYAVVVKEGNYKDVYDERDNRVSPNAFKTPLAPDAVLVYRGKIPLNVKTSSPMELARYAFEELGARRWPAAEPRIMMDLKWAVFYAQHVIKGRWPELEAESALVKNPMFAAQYAAYVIKGRWPEAEPYIARDAEMATDYAVYNLKGRFPAAEALIAQDPRRAFLYAKGAVRGRWPEGEAAIAELPGAAFQYARQVLKHRWPEAEAVIQDGHWSDWNSYQDLFVPEEERTEWSDK